MKSVENKFEKWIEERVKDGTFPSREEALRVMAYYAWAAKDWYKALIGAKILVRDKPVTLEKVLETNGDIFKIERDENMKGLLYPFVEPACNKYRIKYYDYNSNLVMQADGTTMDDIYRTELLKEAKKKASGDVWYEVYCLKDDKEERIIAVEPLDISKARDLEKWLEN